MSRHEVKSRERFLAKTKAQKMAYVSGIPHHYWADDESQPTFRTLECGDGLVSAKQQQEWANSLFTEKNWQRPYLVVIGSDPTDDAAMSMAMRLARTMIDRKVEIVVQNLGSLKPVEADEDETVAFFGHNVMADMTAARAQTVRDWLEEHPGHLRVLVVAGNPAEAIFRRIRIDPDAIFLLDDTRRKTTSLA